jgi:hypothetical protein
MLTVGEEQGWSVGPYFMLREPQFLGSVHVVHDKRPIVGDQGLKLAAQRIALDPIEHIAAVAGAGGDGVVRIDVRNIVPDVLKALHEITVRSTAFMVSIFSHR